jgi:hypothetical protein
VTTTRDVSLIEFWGDLVPQSYVDAVRAEVLAMPPLTPTQKAALVAIFGNHTTTRAVNR